jgi:hypothetical protein
MSDDEFEVVHSLPKRTSKVRNSLSARSSLLQTGGQSHKQTRHFSLFGAGFSARTASPFSQGNTLSPVPVWQAKNALLGEELRDKSGDSSKGRVLSPVTPSAKKAPVKAFSAKQKQKRRRSWLAHRQIAFESGGFHEPDTNIKVYLDDLAKKRTQESSKHDRVQKQDAILHHRDSALGRQHHVEATRLEPVSAKPRSAPVTSPAPPGGNHRSANTPQANTPLSVANGIARALKKLAIFANCSTS